MVDQKYRLLDIDDLIILRRLGEGVRFKYIARELQLTPPAVSIRIRKYEQIWEDFRAKSDPILRSVVINDPAKEVCRRACEMLDALGEDHDAV